MRVRLLLPVLLLALLAGPRAWAHPHVWVDASLTLEMQEGKVTGLAITWLFDDFYSELARSDFDQDGDGTLSQQELDALAGVSALNLSENSFFTHLRVGAERRRVPVVQGLYIEDDGVQLLYRFRVTLPTPVDPVATPFAVGLFDEGYYVDIALSDKEIQVQDSACRMVPREALDEPLYYGTYYPTYYHLVCGTS